MVDADWLVEIDIDLQAVAYAGRHRNFDVSRWCHAGMIRVSRPDSGASAGPLWRWRPGLQAGGN